MIVAKHFKRFDNPPAFSWMGISEDGRIVAIAHRNDLLTAYIEEFHCQRKVATIPCPPPSFEEMKELLKDEFIIQGEEVTDA
jgi:hypothetical protein